MVRQRTRNEKRLQNPGSSLRHAGGNFLQSRVPRDSLHPLQKLPIIASALSFARTLGAAKRKTAGLPKIELRLLPPQRQWLQIIGVFGEGSQEALFVRPPWKLFQNLTDSETISKSPRGFAAVEVCFGRKSNAQNQNHRNAWTRVRLRRDDDQADRGRSRRLPIQFFSRNS